MSLCVLLWPCKMLVKSKRADDDYQRQLYKRESSYYTELKQLRYVSTTGKEKQHILNEKKNFLVS